MKKKIWSLLMMVCLPFAAHAQIPLSDMVIHNAVNDLKPALCANNLQEAMQKVEDCYTKVDVDHTHQAMNQCVLEDILVMTAIKQQARYSASKNISDSYLNSDFMKKINIQARIHKYPNFMLNSENPEEPKKNALKILMVSTMKMVFALKQESCFNPQLMK